MGVFKSQEKVLAVAPDYYSAAFWCSYRINQWICNCTFHLYTFLGSL